MLTQEQRYYINNYTNIDSYDIVGDGVIDIKGISEDGYDYLEISTSRTYNKNKIPITIRNIDIPKTKRLIYWALNCEKELTEIQDIPNGIYSLNISVTSISKLPKLPKSLKRLLVYRTQINDFSSLFDCNLDELLIDKNQSNNEDIKMYQQLTGCQLL